LVRRHAPLNLSPCREEEKEDSSRESVSRGGGEREGDGGGDGVLQPLTGLRCGIDEGAARGGVAAVFEFKNNQGK
jgi:hypothetical protein